MHACGIWRFWVSETAPYDAAVWCTTRALVNSSLQIQRIGNPMSSCLKRALPWLLLLVPTPGLVIADDAQLGGFLQAERAIKTGEAPADGTLISGLREHPLYPYLLFAQLTIDLAAAPDGSIESFLDAFGDTQLGERLRPVYLDRLAAAGRWSDYARVYRPSDSVERQCLYLRALMETGRMDQALDPELLRPLWLSGRSRPDACDPLFSAWGEQGGLTPALIWKRFRLAMEAGQLGLARYLGGRLPESEKLLAIHWLAVYAKPQLLLDQGRPFAGHPMEAAFLAQGIVRLARSRPAQASVALGRYQDVLVADQAAWDWAHGSVARTLLESGLESDQRQGLALWDRVSATVENFTEQERRIRAAILIGAWDRVVDWINRMPEGEIKADRWLYWLARAHEALGNEILAQAIFTEAARERSLWGFLAADRLGLPYQLEHQATPAEPEAIRRVIQDPAMVRILALRRLGRQTDMRREWRVLTRNMGEADLMAAAYIADVLRWHDQAIFTLAKTGYWDDLTLRFPLRYRELVEEQSWQTGLPQDWIFAVMRQESVFAPDVASGAGALGLMQLMPATAGAMWRELGLGQDGLSRRDILDPEINITLGSAYLAQMRDRFGHAALATAAYNAGPHRVDRWLPQDCMEADLWILSIPFSETRGYVQRVLAYRVIYGDRLGLDPVRISNLLPPVFGKDR